MLSSQLFYYSMLLVTWCYLRRTYLFICNSVLVSLDVVVVVVRRPVSRRISRRPPAEKNPLCVIIIVILFSDNTSATVQ